MAVKNIGLALSGGGFRAAVYHMGVLARLAESNLLEQVKAISTVSGGSLGTGLIFALNGFRWPTSREYRETVLPRAREHIITQDLQSDLISRVLYAVVTLQWGALLTRADDLSQLLRRRWGINIPLSQLPDRPRWYINATCYETAKNWRFEKNRLGDYVYGYTRTTDRIRLSDALAASAGFPGLVGALALDTTRHEWARWGAADDEVPGEAADLAPRGLRPREYPRVHLWDGGVYDNNGLEVFHDFDQPRWQRGVDFLVVSDASGPTRPERYAIGTRAILRIITGVMMPQIRSLRARAVVGLMRQPDTKARGAYLHIGNTCAQVLTKARVKPRVVARRQAGCLPADVVARTESLQTAIRRLSPEEFQTVFRHGFEVADYTLVAYHPRDFKYLGYLRSRWPAIVP